MLKKWTATAGVISLLVVAFAASMLLTACKASVPTTPTASTTTGTASSPTSGVAGTATGSTQGQVTLSATATAGETSSAPSPVGMKSVTGALRPFPPLPDPKVPARAAGSPAAKGQTLAPLTNAPDPTISAMKAGSIPNGAQYRITMRPYGIGPDLAFGSRLVIRVDSVKPVGSAPTKSLLVHANLLALADTTRGGTVTKGGTYTATLTFRFDGSKMMLPILSNVKAAR